MTTISPEAFMAQPSEPDEEQLEPGVFIPEYLTQPAEMPPYDPNPLDSIAQSLRQLVNHFESAAFDGGLADSVREDLLDLEAKHDTVVALVEEIDAIIKPSTSKLANQVRAAIKAWRDPEVPAEPLDEDPDPDGARTDVLAVPAHEAPIEEWVAFAESQGIEDASRMNRSMIRSALGISQPVEVGA